MNHTVNVLCYRLLKKLYTIGKKMIQKSFIISTCFAVLITHRTIIPAVNLPGECWLNVISFTDYDPSTIYYMKQVSKDMRAGVNYFLSKIVTPMTQKKSMLSSYPSNFLSTNQCWIEIKNNSFMKHLRSLDETLKIKQSWDSAKQVKYISFLDEVSKNNLRMLDYFITYLSNSTQIAALDCAKLCECFKYHQFIVFLFYTKYHDLKFRTPNIF